MKLVLLQIFLAGLIIGWGCTTLYWRDVARKEVKSTVEKIMKNGILRDKHGNIYIAVPR